MFSKLRKTTSNNLYNKTNWLTRKPSIKSGTRDHVSQRNLKHISNPHLVLVFTEPVSDPFHPIRLVSDEYVVSHKHGRMGLQHLQVIHIQQQPWQLFIACGVRLLISSLCCECVGGHGSFTVCTITMEPEYWL